MLLLGAVTPQLLLGSVTPPPTLTGFFYLPSPQLLLGAITPPALNGCCYPPPSFLSLWGHQSEEGSLCSPTLIGSSWEMLGAFPAPPACFKSLHRKVWLLTQPVLVGSLVCSGPGSASALFYWSDMLSALPCGASQIVQVHIWTARPETAGRCLDCPPV